MRVLFLDVDGVLNNYGFWERRSTGQVEPSDARESRLHPRHFVDPQNIACLNALLDQTDARVVVSSTWRLPTVGQNRNLMHQMGVKQARQRVIGSTPDLTARQPRGFYIGATRGREIQAWLTENGTAWGVERFAIVDDDADMGDLLPYLVRTNPVQGLTEADTARLAELLGVVDVTTETEVSHE